MGIEDLDVNSTEYADRVLLVGNDRTRLKDLRALLEKRSYVVHLENSVPEACEYAADNLTDLVIVASGDPEADPQAIGFKVSRDSALKMCPCVILTANSERLAELTSAPDFGSNIQFLHYDATPADILVKCATLLRMRKLKAESGSFNVDLASQNNQLRDLTQRFQNELAEARQIQQSLLPSSLPKDERCAFAAAYVPLEAVGGDLYDVWKIDEDTFGFFVGDVTGHGLSAAFIGAMSKMALSHAGVDSAEQMLSEMNDSLAQHIPEGRFITVVAGRLNAATGEIQIARGGHPPGIIWRASSGEVEESGGDGMPLGVIAGVPYVAYQTTLSPGDRVFFITDGITETADMNGEMIGMEGLKKRIANLPNDASLADCLKDILTYQKEFTAGRLLKDDTTLLALSVTAK